MPALDISASQRFSLTLDPGLVLERMILSRLSELKRKRGQDWLRSLLVQGFLVEGQWLRRERQSDRDGAAPARSHDPNDAVRELAGARQRAYPACVRPCAGIRTTHRHGHRTGCGIETVRPSPQRDRVSP